MKSEAVRMLMCPALSTKREAYPLLFAKTQLLFIGP
jgi:hypothetical protein